MQNTLLQVDCRAQEGKSFDKYRAKGMDKLKEWIREK
jgi:hypothetical protein